MRFHPNGLLAGGESTNHFLAVPTNRSTFLKVQQNLGIFLSIPKNISIFSGATFFYWFFEYPNSVSRRVWPLDFIVVVECCWVMKWDLVRPCRCGRIFRLLQLRKFVGRKRCHDDEYALCYKCIVRNVYIYIYRTYIYNIDDSDTTVIAKNSEWLLLLIVSTFFWYSFLIQGASSGSAFSGAKSEIKGPGRCPQLWWFIIESSHCSGNDLSQNVLILLSILWR